MARTSKIVTKAAVWAGHKVWETLVAQPEAIEIEIPRFRQAELNRSRVNYTKHIKSAKWRKKALAAKTAAGFRCQVCNTPASDAPLQTHHRTYANLGNENPEDIIVLCDLCHMLFHRHRRLWRP